MQIDLIILHRVAFQHQWNSTKTNDNKSIPIFRHNAASCSCSSELNADISVQHAHNNSGNVFMRAVIQFNKEV